MVKLNVGVPCLGRRQLRPVDLDEVTAGIVKDGLRSQSIFVGSCVNTTASRRSSTVLSNPDRRFIHFSQVVCEENSGVALQCKDHQEPFTGHAMFRLVRYFSITSLGAFVGVTLLLALLYRQNAINDLIALRENSNAALTQIFANSMWKEFVPFVDSVSQIAPERLQTHPSVVELRQAVLDQMAGLSVVKVKVYNLDGLTVFSTETTQIGEDKSTNAGFLAARSGVVKSELTHRDTFSAFEGVIEDRDLIASYVPIRPNGPNGPIEGVLEVYDDVTPFLDRIQQTEAVLVASMVAILALLYAVLFVIVRHGHNVMKRQYAEREQAEQALRNQKEFLDQVLNMTPSAIFVKDWNGKFILVNAALAAIYGTTADNLIGKSDGDFNPNAEEVARYLEADREVMTSLQEKVIPEESITNVVTGKMSWFQTVKVPLRIDGQVSHVLGIASDITRRRELEAELRKALAEERELSELKSRFSTMVSHEFRTPLATIQSSTDLLKLYGLKMTDEQKRAHLDKVQYQVKHLTEILEQILVLSRATDDQTSFRPTEIDLPGYCADLVEHARQMSGREEIAVRFVGTPIPVSLDPKLLRQILMNLLVNAAKFSPENSPVELIVTFEDGSVRFDVQDRGIGIPEADENRLFDLFHRGGNVGATEGTGLGLAIVRRAAEFHQGTVSFESELRVGTTFTIVLPSLPVEAELAEDDTRVRLYR